MLIHERFVLQQRKFLRAISLPIFCNCRRMKSSMQTSPSSRLPGLDTLRSIAILGVMVFHLQWMFPPVLAPVAHFGWAAVDLFFVLSGYLIGAQLLKAHRDGAGIGLWRFYRRRLYRILPAYLVVLALYFLWPMWREADHISPLWEFLSFTENLFVDYAHNQAFSHVWSLCIEEQFYLFFPLIVLVMMRRPSFGRTVALLLALVAIGIAFRTFIFLHVLRHAPEDDYGTIYIQKLYYPTLGRMDGLLAGVALALIKLFRPAWWQRLADRGHAGFALGVALTGISLWLFDDRFGSRTGPAEWSTFIGFPLLSLGLALVVASGTSSANLLGRTSIPGAQSLATLAYALYLTHKETAHLAEQFCPSLTGGRSGTALAVVASSCLCGAAILHFAVERPFMLLRDGLERGHPASVEDEMRAEPVL
jgi:peptidoglycan/LPS O-acetylase OafA/YrhL